MIPNNIFRNFLKSGEKKLNETVKNDWRNKTCPIFRGNKDLYGVQCYLVFHSFQWPGIVWTKWMFSMEQKRKKISDEQHKHLLCYTLLMFIFPFIFFYFPSLLNVSYQLSDKLRVYKNGKPTFRFLLCWLCAHSFVGVSLLLLFHSFDLVPMIFLSFAGWVRLAVFIFLFVFYVLHADDK